jgi:nitrate/nitrite-specific signal transduction histidine kinase
MEATRAADSDTSAGRLRPGTTTGSLERRNRPGIRFKLLVFIFCGSLTGVLLTTAILYSFHRRQLIDSAQSASSAMTYLIEANIIHAMMDKDWAMIQNIVQSTASGGSVYSIRILDLDGVVEISSAPAEVGTHFDRASPFCQNCHQSQLPSSVQTVVSSSASGKDVFLSVKSIENQTECQACHNSSDRILGLLMIETPLSPVNEQLRGDMWRAVGLGAGVIGLLMALMIPALNRTVIRPIEQLSRGVVEVSKGNLDTSIPVSNQGELGRLAESFNLMQQKLKRTYREMAYREQELVVLNEVAAAATQLDNLQDSIQSALETIVDRLGFSAGLVYLKNGEEACCSVRASYKVPEPLSENLRYCAGVCGYLPSGGVIQYQDIFVRDLASDPRFKEAGGRAKNYTLIEMKLRSKEKDFGAMVIVAPPEKPITERSLEYLRVVGREIGIAIDNTILLADSQRREIEAATLYELGTKISNSLALRNVLGAAAEAARQLIGTDWGLVGLLDEIRQQIVIEATAGDGGEHLSGMRLLLNSSQRAWLIETAPIMGDVEDLIDPQLNIHEIFSRINSRSYLMFPLQRGGQILGSIGVLTSEHRQFTEREVQLLESLGHHVAVSIENAQLYWQLRSMAALEERDRLARELHDHLAQALGYMNVKASIIDDLLGRGQFDNARENLDELKTAAKITYTDVREAIFNLRTDVTTQASFLAALQDYLEEYRTTYKINVHLEAQDEVVEFTSEVASQVLRIIQEALTNVRKHAGASQVLIHCQKEGSLVAISIQDDGRGFSLERSAGERRQSYGLQIMKERAESVGGSLELYSQPGKGTRVTIRVPGTITYECT